MAKVASTTPKKIPSIRKCTGPTRNHIYIYIHVYVALLPSSPLGIATLNTHALSLDPLPIFKGQRDNHNCQHQWTKNNRLDWGIQPALANTKNLENCWDEPFSGDYSVAKPTKTTHIFRNKKKCDKEAWISIFSPLVHRKASPLKDWETILDVLTVFENHMLWSPSCHPGIPLE